MVRIVTAVRELALLDDPDRLTITAIVNRAGVSRPTFYAAFPDVPASLAAAADDLLREVFSGIHPAPPGTVDDSVIAEHLGTVLTRLRIHTAFFSRVLPSRAGFRVLRGVIEFVVERLLGTPSAHTDVEAVEAVAAGAVWLIYRWLDSGCEESIAHVVTRVTGFITR